jgi:signal transduction histidine kinase
LTNKGDIDALRIDDLDREALVAIVDGAPRYVLVIDREGEAIAVNRVFRERFDLPDEAARKRFLHAEGDVVDVRLRDRAGEEAQCVWSKHNLPSGAVAVYGICANQLSEESQKFAEEAKELRQLNENKNRLFSIISHDLRAPFTSLLGYTDLIMEDYDEMDKEETLHFVRSINSTAKSMFDLLNNLLEWSRLQMGRVDVRPETIDVGASADRVSKLLAQNAEQKGVEFTQDVQPGVTAWADPRMFETVLRNLLSNALKFTDRGGTVRVFAETTDEDVIVGVEDTGVGVAENDRDSIFRYDPNRKQKGEGADKGAGIGLSLCRSLVDKMRGEIDFVSELGVGSTFTVRLPATPAVARKRASD